jgi:hypothetical protein
MSGFRIRVRVGVGQRTEKREKGENSQGERIVKTVSDQLTCGKCIT